MRLDPEADARDEPGEEETVPAPMVMAALTFRRSAIGVTVREPRGGESSWSAFRFDGISFYFGLCFRCVYYDG